MNVTKNGYYSKDYLDKKRNRMSRRYIDDSESGSEWSNMMYDDEEEYSVESEVEPLYHEEHQPRGQEFQPKSILKLSGGNQQSNGGVKQNARFTSDLELSSSTTDRASQVVSTVSKSSSKSSPKEENPASEDPDYLVEGMTPAQLIHQQRLPYAYYDNGGVTTYSQHPGQYQNRNTYYRVPSRGGSGYYTSGGRGYDDGYSNYIVVPRKRRDNKVISQFSDDDYYIKQQKRYDSMNGNFTKYKHKTFREVFDDEHGVEKEDGYSPMEFVFQPSSREKNNDKNLKKTFNTITGRKDYNDYDYYEQLDREKKLKQAKIEAEERREKELSEKVYLNEAEELELKERRKKLKRLKFGNMLKFGKKKPVAVVDPETDNEGHVEEEEEEVPPTDSVFKDGDGLESIMSRNTYNDASTYAGTIGRDDSTTGPGTVSLHPSHISVVSKKSDKLHGQVVTAPVSNIPIGANANPNFTWWWNYILSWIVYDRPVEEEPTYQETKSLGGITKSLRSSKSKKSSALVPVSPKVDTTDRYEYEQELSPWKKIKKIPENTRNTWRTLQQPADKKFIKGGWSAALEAAKQKADREGMEVVAIDGNSIITSPKSAKNLGYEYDPITEELQVEVEGGMEPLPQLYYNPYNKELDDSPPSLYNSLSLPMIFDTTGETGPVAIISNIASAIKSIKVMRMIFAPIDVLGEAFPSLQTLVIMLELVIFVWILYELSLLVDALCMMVKAVCAPMIAVGKFMNRIM